MIITRKIQVYVNEVDKELKKDFIHSLYGWRDMVRRAANIISSHRFMQDSIKDMFYITEEVKIKLADISKDPDGIFNTSGQNTTYQVISKLFKGQLPSDIYSCLNQAVSNVYKETKSDLLKGECSLRTFKNSIPIPFSAKAINGLAWNENKFIFTLFGIPLATFLGYDHSNNKAVIEKILTGEYKLCSSSLQINDENKKMFLLVSIDVPVKQNKLDPNKILEAELDVEMPIKANIGKKVFTIGGKEEFLYRRTQIQEKLKRLQISCKYNNGNSRAKMKAIDRFHHLEKNYIDTKMHLYSKMLISLAVKNECGKIVLKKQIEKEENAKDDVFVLRNWSYYGLIDKITYKSKMNGIELSKE